MADLREDGDELRGGDGRARTARGLFHQRSGDFASRIMATDSDYGLTGLSQDAGFRCMVRWLEGQASRGSGAGSRCLPGRGAADVAAARGLAASWADRSE